MTRLLLVGAGGHGLVVAEAANMSRVWGKIVFADDKHPSLQNVLEYEVKGGCREPRSLREFADCVVAAVGDNGGRLELLEKFSSCGFAKGVVVHPTASVSTSAKIGGGAVVLANAVVNARAKIGLACIVNSGATVDHDCVLEEAVHVAPGVHLAADVHVGRRTWIGIGAVVRNQVRIGRDVIVGAGAAVVSDIPDNSTVVGVPARAL